MKAGLKITAADLKKLGWENTGATFGYSQIWKKGDLTILYDHNVQTVCTVLGGFI